MKVLRLLYVSCILLVSDAAASISPRLKRSLLFTSEAGMGIYLAVAFPVDLPQYDISMSINVEANYYLPDNATKLAYGPQFTEVRRARDLTRSRMYSLIEDHLERKLCDRRGSILIGWKCRSFESMIFRETLDGRVVFEMVPWRGWITGLATERKGLPVPSWLERLRMDLASKEGFSSRQCLLRTICETSASTVLGHNGLLGELLHILFTPSSTASETLSQEYSDAEMAGLEGRDNCVRAYSDCPIDLYELFTMWNT